MKTVLEEFAPLLRQRHGPLTEELILRPGAFGLGKVPARLQPDDTTALVCGFCSTGCSLNAHLRKGQAINLTPADYPVNLGMACPKGWEALTPLDAPDRATTPLLRNPGGTLEPVDWDTALQAFTLRMKAIQECHGPESIAWIGTGQITNEELAFLGCLAKFGMGMIHGDGNTRQCMATSVVAYKESFGFDAPPYTYADFEASDVIVLIGSNLCIAHPILWQRVLRNPHQPEIIVIDPRRTETAMAATRHCAIKPKSDLLLLYGVARILIERGWIDHRYIAQHTTGFDAFAEFLRNLNPADISRSTGLSTEEIHQLAETIHRGHLVSFWWTMGINQGHESTRTAQAIINLALMTGNMGRPGTGANSITGQCNAMGSRLFSNTTNLLGGHDFTNAAHRQKISRALGLSPERVPARNSWAYDQILEGIETGAIRGLWIVATNTAHSWMEQKRARELLSRLDFLVVQDMYHSTETARQAHLVLPAAGWGEKDGTVTNSERRIGLLKKVSRAPGQALADFKIFQLVAHYWGCAELFREWTSPEAVFQILKRITAGQPCDITGIRDYRMLDECGGVQWPFPEKDSTSQDSDRTSGDHADAAQDQETRIQTESQNPLPATERGLFEDGRYFHSDGKARFIFATPRPMPEPTSDDYPFLLLTGRGTSAQWHTQTRTGKSDVLRKLSPEKLYAEISPIDAEVLGIIAGERVKVTSRRGEVTAVAFVTSSVAPGQVFLPMHYADTNNLTLWTVDPHSRQPAYKACAVAIRRL